MKTLQALGLTRPPNSGPGALAPALAAVVLALGLALPAAPVQAQSGNDTVLEAREAARKRDRNRLAAARAAVRADHHPLAVWVDYWELGSRLGEAKQDELDAFYARWPGSYLEDRLRNDWLLELGKRRDWAGVRAEYPRFVLKDDREAACYALLARHADGEDVRAEGREAWLAQRDADDGCALLASTLFDARRLGDADVWHKTRLAVEANRPKAARQAAALLGEELAAAVSELSANPQRYLMRKATARERRGGELVALALIRAGAADPDAAAEQLRSRWAAELAPETAAWVWATLGKQSALKLGDSAPEHFQRAVLAPPRSLSELRLPDDTLAWKARAALRANGGAGRWQQVVQAIHAMSAAEQREATWVYWKARALLALAAERQDGAGLAAEARTLLGTIAGAQHFYGQLAAEDLGWTPPLPPTPAPLSAEERAAAAARPGLQRALALIDIGLRSEGVREWNYTLRGLNDRELLAAAQLACEREVWDRCINTSERTLAEVDMAQRFPTPFRSAVLARAEEAGLDPAYVYGLIRQESRFLIDARSGVGASGLMQLMPATARWTARKLGLEGYKPQRITEQDVNLRLGTGYLKLVLDSFEGSMAMATAGYNAGPSRPRRWREGPVLDAAAWAENIPFSETRDYVKKVLHNATQYAAVLSGEPQSLRARLGASIGPRLTQAPADERDLP
jgi:soluble lytic murein transglycosylase